MEESDSGTGVEGDPDAPTQLTSAEEMAVFDEVGDTAAFSALHSDKSAVGRVLHPSKLERKHSSGDLHSRLKTRKMLGVGETDNGDIHRSKISQVLGHNEHLYLRLPKGYWKWQSFLALLLATQAVFIITFPKKASELGLVGIPVTVCDSQSSIPSQYYAVSMLALSYLLWKFLDVRDKGITRAVQFAAFIHFAAVALIDILHVANNGLSILKENTVLLMSVLRLSIAIVSFLYLIRIGNATSGLRGNSNSNKKQLK